MSFFPLASVLVLLATITGIDSSTSISEQYRAISLAYDHEMKEWNRDHAKAQSIRHRRDKKLSRLIAEAKHHPIDSLDSEDLLSLALAHEQTESLDDCIRYARECVKGCKPDDDRGFFPLIRQLINAGRLVEARQWLAQAEQRCDQYSRARAFHGSLFLASRRERDWDQALHHIMAALKYFTDASIQHDDLAPLVARNCRRLRELIRDAGVGQNEYRSFRSSQIPIVRRRIASLQKSEMNVNELRTMIGQYNVLLEIESQKSEVLAEWIDAVINALTSTDDQDRHALIDMALMHVGNNVMHCAGETLPLEDSIKRCMEILDELPVSNESEKHKRILTEIQAIVLSHRSMARLLGQPWHPISDFDWCDTREARLDNVHVAVFWRPGEAYSRYLLTTVLERARRYQRLGATFELVTPYATPTKQSGLGTADGESLVTPAQQKVILKQWVSNSPRNLIPGLYDSRDCETRPLPTKLPAFVVIDHNQKVQQVIWGLAQSQMSFLEEEIERLAVESKDATSRISD